MKALKPVNREKTRYVELEIRGIEKVDKMVLEFLESFIEHKMGYFEFRKSFLSMKSYLIKKEAIKIIYQINRSHVDLFIASIILLDKINNTKVQPLVVNVSGSIKKVK